MSWGERSCKHFGGNCPVKGGPTLEGCNVSCHKYQHDGKTKPDSTGPRRILVPNNIDNIRRIMESHKV